MALRAAELRRLLLLRGGAVLPLPLALRCRPASTAARDDEGAGSNAYDVAAAAGSRRFLQILAAYEILSDSQRRAHYDSFLRSQRLVIQKHPRPSQYVYPVYPDSSGIVMPRESNVVEWLKWYRLTVNDIVTNKRIVTGSGYFDRLESELYTAVHAAYYGPEVESMDLLPDCFEAEERSVYEISELLHLVSGRDLLGIVSLVDSVPELSEACPEKLTHSGFGTCGVSPNVAVNREKCSIPRPADIHKQENEDSDSIPSDAYKDIELKICGRVVATANRRLKCNCIVNSDMEDHIHVFLAPNEAAASQEHLLLGTITGLDTSGEEGSCCVYDSHGIKTHVIVKHRTLMVKHMHWYQFGDEVSPCECRCSRARLPPSRFWLFEPRCYMHDTGGWYIETFGRDKKGRTIPSPRQWHGVNEHSEKRLHPALYLVALAYRSLDLEDAQRRKWSFRTFLELQLSHIRQFGKKIFSGKKGVDMGMP
uniref:Predicted protein n=1 Tax=Hordeum vulgare subsp. vulgare TaxID=112509 RepID=F2E3E0_HORVV|nr:predicted protein [Hordeum vulgare subsp. vulgare]